jgi:hypothetical protein
MSLFLRLPPDPEAAVQVRELHDLDPGAEDAAPPARRQGEEDHV